ncbi:hypothetical protein PY67_10445 [Lacticaseibacillus rhamnosus]|nr:hypothetical protein PY67_10445 [Lacticaseibacillus rhamnosus]
MKHSSKRVQSIQQAEKTVHVRFRMYKAKKRWLIAGTALLLMPAFFQPGQEVHADSKSPQTTAVTSQSGATAETTAKTATGNPQPAGTATQNQRLLQVVRLSMLLVLQPSHLHQAPLVQL